MTQPFLGEIKMFGGNFAPNGYAFCNGALLAISQNTALFSILGTTYGGNGTSTFQLPNMQGRSPVHWGNGQGLSPIVLGEEGGAESVTLNQTQLPSHTHTFSAVSGGGTTGTPGPGEFLAGSTARDRIYSSAAADTSLNGIGAAGSNLPFAIRPPYLGVTFIIALLGIFPSRN
jgi:microcystin-dependent protein